MGVLTLIFLFVAVIVLGPLMIIFLFVHLRRRAVNKHELQALWDEIAAMKAEIDDLKEQLADFIIRTD